MATRLDPTTTCLNLRCKQMFYEVDDEGADEALAPGDARAPRTGASDTTCFWCSRTQTGRGPDDKPVGRDACSSAGRPCFEGVQQLA